MPECCSGSSAAPTWRGIPRDQIEWHPTVDPELCIGCGICVLNCGKTFTNSIMKRMSLWLQDH